MSYGHWPRLSNRMNYTLCFGALEGWKMGLGNVTGRGSEGAPSVETVLAGTKHTYRNSLERSSSGTLATHLGSV